jgi:hypothetical protein
MKTLADKIAEPEDKLENMFNPICPRCGCCEMFWEDCWSCGGEGIHDDLFEEDPLWYDPGDYEICNECEGKGGFWLCDCDKNGKHN